MSYFSPNQEPNFCCILRSARESSKRDKVGGFIIGGLHSGESPEERLELLEASVSELPLDKPRVLVGSETPLDILQAVGGGVDIIHTSYPYVLAVDGWASIFWNGAMKYPEEVTEVRS
jgi:tRNA-guanine family transglycosylase